MKKRNKIKTIIYHIIMCGFSVLMLYPLLWMVASSFKEELDIFLDATSLIPKNFTIEHYIRGWRSTGKYTFTDYFKNSLFLATTIPLINVTFSLIVAYGYARIPFRGRKTLFAIEMACLCLPGMVLMVPSYLLYNSYGWIGTFLPLIIPAFCGNSYKMFMLMQFMKGVPKELDEAARMDGCGWIKLFTHIMIPLIKPAIILQLVTSFIQTWNDYEGALIYLNKPNLYPAAFALTLFEDDISASYGPTLAMGFVTLIPIIILFAFFQRQLVDGIATTGLKG